MSILEPSPSDATAPTNPYVVGIGAAAGGSEDIFKLFDQFPSNTNYSFIIIQPLNDDKNQMIKLLTKHTQMQVREAENNIKPLPNCVYVGPSGKQLTLENGLLHLENIIHTREPNFAIDVFFKSLAKDRGRFAIGILLSGTDTDGNKGLKKIKAAGGIVLVQDFKSAKLDGLPNSVLETGFADYMCAPEHMPNQIIRFTQQIQDVQEPTSSYLQQNRNQQYLEAFSEEFNTAGLFVDENFKILHSIGQYNRFFQLPSRSLQPSLLKIVDKDLAGVLSAEVGKVFKLQNTVKRQIRIQKAEHDQMIQLTFKPITLEEGGPKVVLILMQELENDSLSANQPQVGATLESESEHFQQIFTLETELKKAQETVRSTAQDLSAATLEIQSTKEKLQTILAEHQIKIRELQELNEDLDNYIRSSNNGQLFLSHNLVIRKFSPAIKDQINIIGLDVGKPIHQVSHNLKHQSWLEDIQHVNETSLEMEREVETLDGRTFLMRILPYLKQNHQKDGVVLSFAEVTTLKELSQLVQGVLNSSLNSIIAVVAARNKEGQIIDFTWSLLNQQAEQLLNKRQEEILQKSIQVQMPFLKKSGLFNKMVHVVEENLPLHGEQNLEINGKWAWYEIAAAKMGDGLTITMGDISDKKIIEEKIQLAYEELERAQEELSRLNDELEKRVVERTLQLSASQERFRMVSMVTNDVIWDWDLTTNKVWWSESLDVVLGYTLEKLGSTINAWFNKIHPEDKERVTKSFKRAINTGLDQWVDEFRVRRADGSFAFLYNRAYLLKNENQKPHRVLGSFIDLSDLKETQEKLKETNAHLLHVIEDLDNFVYTASHDLKTPIHNIEALLRELKLELPAKETAQVDVHYIMDMMQGAIERFKKTIDNLTEITKLQNENIVKSTSVSVAEVVHDVLLDLDSMLTESKAHLIMDEASLPIIHYSEKNLRSIIYNLLSNAIKYHSPERQPLVELTCTVEKNLVVLSVKDNGLGMNVDQQEQLFTMFQRFHDHVEGSGIGLYMVRKIVRNAGGRIEVESDLEKGSTFRVYLKQ